MSDTQHLYRITITGEYLPTTGDLDAEPRLPRKAVKAALMRLIGMQNVTARMVDGEPRVTVTVDVAQLATPDEMATLNTARAWDDYAHGLVSDGGLHMYAMTAAEAVEGLLLSEDTYRLARVSA